MAKDNRQKKAQIAAKKAAKEAKRAERKGGRSTTTTNSTAKTSTAPKKRSTKKKKSGAPVGKIIVYVLSLLLIVAVVIFAILAIKYVKNLYASPEDNGDDSNTLIAEERDDVAYYVIGLMGKLNEDTGKTGTTQMLSLVCYDKHAKTINVMQIPPSTYLGDKDRWSVDTIGKVWSNPKPLKWCETCRRQVFESEISDGKHNVTLDDGTKCDTKITKKAGSSVLGLMDVFSYQYTIPVDNFYIMPQQAFVDLVDYVGGIDVKLSSSQTLGDISYSSGIQTLDGAAALDYVLGDVDSINSQVKNMVHQRQAFVALFERLMACDEKALDDDVLYPVMKSSTPIRTKRENEIAKDITLMVKLLKELNKIDRSNIHMYVLPGERATYNGNGFYSVHKNELCDLLNQSFNPYDTAISEEFLRMTELANSSKCDLQEATFEQLLVNQKGIIEESEDEEE